VVGNLLHMSRLQTGTVTPIIRETDLDEVVPMALGGVPEESVELDIPETLPMVHVDRGLLERAVANVVENAVKYSPAGRKVLVSASALADRVEVRVVDRGPGVPDEAKDRIFEPFQRYGDSSRGAGVGLAVARGFTEAIGGHTARRGHTRRWPHHGAHRTDGTRAAATSAGPAGGGLTVRSTDSLWSGRGGARVPADGAGGAGSAGGGQLRWGGVRRRGVGACRPLEAGRTAGGSPRGHFGSRLNTAFDQR
jgi:signal transduction histidine kinase